MPLLSSRTGGTLRQLSTNTRDMTWTDANFVLIGTLGLTKRGQFPEDPHGAMAGTDRTAQDVDPVHALLGTGTGIGTDRILVHHAGAAPLPIVPRHGATHERGTAEGLRSDLLASQEPHHHHRHPENPETSKQGQNEAKVLKHRAPRPEP